MVYAIISREDGGEFGHTAYMGPLGDLKRNPESRRVVRQAWVQDGEIVVHFDGGRDAIPDAAKEILEAVGDVRYRVSL